MRFLTTVILFTASVSSTLFCEQIETNPKAIIQYTITPELYLGYLKSSNYHSEHELIKDTPYAYSYTKPLLKDTIGLKGQWKVNGQNITCAHSGSTIDLKFCGSIVHASLYGITSEPLTFMLDGKPLAKEYYTSDMDSDGNLFLDGARKYDLCNLHGDMLVHQLTVVVPENVSICSFTFGKDR